MQNGGRIPLVCADGRADKTKGAYKEKKMTKPTKQDWESLKMRLDECAKEMAD